MRMKIWKKLLSKTSHLHPSLMSITSAGHNAGSEADEDDHKTDSSADQVTTFSIEDFNYLARASGEEHDSEAMFEEPFSLTPEKLKSMYESMWRIECEAYDFNNFYHWIMEGDKSLRPRDMKFLIDWQDTHVRDPFGKVMKTVRTPSVHKLMDNMVQQFCLALGMTQVTRMPTVEERMFLWSQRDTAFKLIQTNITPKSQIFFLNYINFDQTLTDLQCLISRLNSNTVKAGRVFRSHVCEYKSDGSKSGHSFLEDQVLCKHMVMSQEFNKPCSVADCFNFDKTLCKCFQMNLFIPETTVLATKTTMEGILSDFDEYSNYKAKWLIRSPTLKSGNGVQVIDSTEELEHFYRYDMRRALRGQFFVLQRYISDPMLYAGHKFDCRMFMLLAVLTERRVMAFLHPGYARLAKMPYSSSGKDLRRLIPGRLQFDPEYTASKCEAADELMADDYCVEYEQLSQLLNLPDLKMDKIDEEIANGSNNFAQRLQVIVQQLALNMEVMVRDKPGTWQLFGLDLNIDSQGQPWLYEVMTYPCQFEPDVTSYTQNRVIPAVLTESLALVFELNQRDFVTRNKQEWINVPDMPINRNGLIAAQKNFLWMHSTAPHKLPSYKQQQQQQQQHWFRQWRVTEDMNDYILYLKNYRLNSIDYSTPVTFQYGRKSFDQSPAFKAKQILKDSLGLVEKNENKSTQL